MERKWKDNAFWDNNEKTRIKAILDLIDTDGTITSQVLTINKENNGQNNPDWDDVISNVTLDKITSNTTERAERKANEAKANEAKIRDREQAKKLEALFNAKLQAFEIDEISNSANRELKSRLRRSKSIIEVNLYAMMIVMEAIENEKIIQSKGYITVASNHINFYYMAINLIESILDNDPEAKITLVTEERFVDHRADVCDKIIFCDDHYRAKLWGMTQTPYDLTLYLDCDMECIHSDISTAFDRIDNHDMVFTPLTDETDYAFAGRYFNKDNPDKDYAFELNGGICLYDNTKPVVKDFLNDWWEYYKKQRDYEWWPTKPDGSYDYETYNRDELGLWDQFTLWWLTKKMPKYKDLDIGLFEDWARWNYYSAYKASQNHNKDLPIIIMHYSNSLKKWDDGAIKP